MLWLGCRQRHATGGQASQSMIRTAGLSASLARATRDDGNLPASGQQQRPVPLGCHLRVRTGPVALQLVLHAEASGG